MGGVVVIPKQEVGHRSEKIKKNIQLSKYPKDQ